MTSIMKKKFLINFIKFFAAFFILFSSVSKAVNWHNDIVIADVVNQDIDIIGTNVLKETIIVTATSTDILVTVTSGDSIVTGTISNDESSQLRLIVEDDHKITFKLDNSLTFKGTDSAGSDGDLLITIEGQGQVVFDIGDGQSISFASVDDSAGTQAFVLMDDVLTASLIFKRQNTNSDEHVEICIGEKSLLSYISKWRNPAYFSPNMDKGIIIFETGNNESAIGRMVLRICDTGGVYIGGNTIKCICWVCPGLGGIDLNDMRGLEARMLVKNSVTGGQASLLVLNMNATRTDLFIDPFEENAIVTERFGFVLGPNGVLRVDDDAYLDYVGLTNNFCPCPDVADDVLFGRDVWSLIKKRNASAFVVDGDPECIFKAKIELGDSSAIYFRSGISRYGRINEISTDGIFSFSVDNFAKTCNEGEMVLDVEGLLNVVGDGEGAVNALQILSLEVTFTGGSVLIDSDETLFPKRTFEKDCCECYISYNKAFFFLNNRMNLFNTHLVHTDQNHRVYENNDICSEPTYVGGENIKFCCVCGGLPKIAFFNSKFYIHTNVGATGLDFFVPNLDEEIGNDSVFKFFNNGSVIDDGTGRQLILGTAIGSTSCDGTLIDPDAHLDVYQDTYQTFTATHNLSVRSGRNNSTIIEGVPDTPLCNQMAVHTVYLGFTSNMSIGGQGLAAGLETIPTFSILGNFFSFETRGGWCCSPENSSTTGVGGIFVDRNGIFLIDDLYRANISAMVTKSENGFVYLPKGKVFFDERVGIADWKLDLATTTTIIPENLLITDYTLNWLDVTKDYGNYCPYQISCVGLCGQCPGITCPNVTVKNITNLPTVLGEVEQLQIKGSRLSNPANLMVDGGRVRELVFLTDCNSAEAPTAFVVLQNEGRVGLGTTHKNVDSLWSSVFLGVNGITLAPNGNSHVDINEDIIINDICSILRGPGFEVDQQEEVVLRITSEHETEIRLLKDGILDLSSFTETSQVVEFGGDIKLILEPGARIRLGGGTLRFADSACVVATSIEDLSVIRGALEVTVTDDFRVDLIGTGSIVFTECASMSIEKWAYVGVVSVDDCSTGTTDITVWLKDKSEFVIGGTCAYEGGVLQIGDTVDGGGSIRFQLIIDGEEAKFAIGSHSFFGLTVGIVDNTWNAPNDWLVDNLYNVQYLGIDIRNGTFNHNRIYPGSEYNASLLSIGQADDAGIYYFGFDTLRATILGGGNMYLADFFGFPDFPEVEDEFIPDLANIMVSRKLIYELAAVTNRLGGYNPRYYDIGYIPNKDTLSQSIVDPFGVATYIFTTSVTGTHLFEFLGIPDIGPTVTSPLVASGGITWWQSREFVIYGAAGPGDKNLTNVGYVRNGFIERFPSEFIRHPRFIVTDHEHTHEVGTVSISFTNVNTGENFDELQDIGEVT